ncbi:hypothetical protein AAVH_01905 [Aphelenchoides avenae]|nr:hypothetical protein AAVH_01905 [Aphelenchus avenae]
MVDEEQLNTEAVTPAVDPDFAPQSGDCRRYGPPPPNDDYPLTDYQRSGQPLGARAAFGVDPLVNSRARTTSAPPTPASTQIELFATSPLVDWSRMPAYLSLEEIRYRTRQFFSFDQDERGRRLSKLDNETLKSDSRRFPQEGFFWIQHQNIPGLVDTSTWQPTNVCYGRDEPKCFHIAVGATLIIIKNRWLRFTQIAARPDLQKTLTDLMRLHIRSFGQMILLVYAVRLAGDHNRMDAVLKFIDEVLRARDLDYDIAYAIKRHVPRMIQGVDAKKDPYPSKKDFGEAAERWCCYCLKAFTQIYKCLSGPTCWSPEWLRTADIPKEFKQAIDKIVYDARWTLYNLKERIYKLYVLRRIETVEAGETIFAWTPFKIGRNAFRSDWPEELRTRSQKRLLLIDDENDHLFGDELQKDVSIVRIPSTNRVDVLRAIRHVLPGPETDRVYFWFGTEYTNNGNNDYGQLITEICHHFTKHLGHIHQYVVLPPYNRLHPDKWTFDVLGLYLQREQLLPHARVILHPYDVRLWHYDQLKLQQNGELPAWTDRYQCADGTINNWSTVEARKLNMRTWHGSDLWTWYKKDAKSKFPPPSIEAKIGEDGEIAKPRSTDVTDTTEFESGCPPDDRPSTSAAAAVPAAVPHQRDAPASSTIDDVETAFALLQEDNSLLGPLFEYAAKKAADQVLEAVQPRIDDLMRRLERLTKTSTATAEDRHKDPRTKQ